jgi:hypothetical protein
MTEPRVASAFEAINIIVSPERRSIGVICVHCLQILEKENNNLVCPDCKIDVPVATLLPMISTAWAVLGDYLIPEEAPVEKKEIEKADVSVPWYKRLWNKLLRVWSILWESNP